MVWDVMICTGLVSIAGALMVSQASQYPREEAKIIRFSFVMHVVFILLNMAVTKYIYGVGDMYAFHRDGLILAEELRSDIFIFLDIVFWMFSFETDFAFHSGSEGTRVMVALAAFSNYLFGDSFAAMSFAPGLVSFFAKLSIFNAFRNQFGKEHRVWVAGAFLCVPSVVFWTAGMIKEAIAVSSFGMVAFGWVGIRSRNPFRLLVLGFGVFLLQSIKAHFLLTGILGLGASLYWQRSVEDGNISVRPVTLVVVVAVAMGAMVGVGAIAPRFAVTNLADEVVLMQSRSSGGSQVDIGVNEEIGPVQLIAVAPLALFTGLFRPWIGEATSAPAAINALETTLLLFVTLRVLYRRRFNGLLRLAKEQPTLVFLVVFSALSALGVGLATGNLGTLSRYRAPIIPFFVLAVLIADLRDVGSKARVRHPMRARG